MINNLKQIKTMKTKHKTLVAKTIAIISIVISSSACSDKSKTEDTKAITKEYVEEKFENKPDEKDVAFLVNAAAINFEEIQLGQLVQQNSKSDCVKELGAMMEKQHTDAMNQLKDLAVKKAITIPTFITQEGKYAVHELNEKTGKDFDKKYCDMMVNGHKDAIAMFDKASEESIDDDIKSWASDMIPVLKTHLDHAITCQTKCK